VQEADSLVENDGEIGKLGNGERDLYLFTLSARSIKALDRLASSYLEYIQSHPNLLIADICYTVNLGRSHFNHRLAMSVTSVRDLQTKLTQYLAQEITSDLWQGKINLNQDVKLALIFQPANQELKELIESIIDSSIVTENLTDIYWEISVEKTLDSEQANIIYSSINEQLNNQQILINGLAQLYILGVKINWQTLGTNSGGKKITLPTYPFQRSIYWLE
jgi:acyl transferase domain-containing protein